MKYLYIETTENGKYYATITEREITSLRGLSSQDKVWVIPFEELKLDERTPYWSNGEYADFKNDPDYRYYLDLKSKFEGLE